MQFYISHFNLLTCRQVSTYSWYLIIFYNDNQEKTYQAIGVARGVAGYATAYPETMD